MASQIPIHDLDPLAEKDLNIARYSTAGIPYRDPSLDLPTEAILNNRKDEVAQKRAGGMPKWYKTP